MAIRRASRARDRAVTMFIIGDWMKRWLPATVLMIGIVALFVLARADFSHEAARLTGTVAGSNWTAGEAMRHTVFVDVRLPDGRTIVATGHLDKPPHEGDQITVVDMVGLWGGHRFKVATP
ncbi:MAG: hypothetical protein R3D33_16365 [Hyphomicrobiaceae bacterium]